MYLSQVKIKNFRGYGENEGEPDHCFVYDDLDSPLVIFHGYNGFGKTSFFEAVEWCLTDNVHRLEKFYQKKTYQANELKRSHYLKFYHPRNGNSEEREIYVELLFDNGLRIIRKSKNNVLRTTDKDSSYSSSVFMGYADLKEVTTEVVLNEFILKTQNKKAFFHTHMLGQEGISDFLRSHSPSGRREIFMHLLQEEELNKLFQSLDKYQARNNSLTIKFNQLDASSKELLTHKNAITEFIEKLDFKNIYDYLAAINEYKNQIRSILTNSELEKDYDLTPLLIKADIGLNNCIQYLQTLSVQQQKVISFREDLGSKYDNLIRLNEKFETTVLLEKAKEHLQKAEAAKRIKEGNSVLLQEQVQECNQQILTLDTTINNLQEKKVSLTVYYNTFTMLSQFISDFSVDIQFWSELNKERSEWEKFIAEFNIILERNMEKPNIEEINNDWFLKVRERSIELQKNKEELQRDLERILASKITTSLLNEQYQEALNSVKKLINSNIQTIDECPVCLNKDFSNNKYNSIEGWANASTTAEKLIAIIDTTFAAGNNQMELLSQRENDINNNIREIDNQYYIEVVNPIILRLKKIRLGFEDQYNFVNQQLQSEIDAQTEERNSLISKRNEFSLQISRIREAITSLFGVDIQVGDLEMSALERFITDSNDWFTSHLNTIGFTNIPTVTELESEITLLRKEYLDGNDHGEVKLEIESVKRKVATLDNLKNKLTEILNKKIPVEYESSIAKFEKIEDLLKVNAEDKQKIVLFREEVSKWHSKLLAKQRQIVKERLENHPIISWVYETINPHPFHKKLHITNTERGTNFIGDTQLEDKIDLYLDQIFSAAQLNILALSIFLGLGLTQRYSQLQQLFMDDPIQSMDDVNILAFIDVLRAIMDSKFSNKHIVVSTHDEDFAQLLSIKMRNRKMVQYRIVGYTEEGPKIMKIK